MRIALIQQHATPDRRHNLERGLEAARGAIAGGAMVVAFAELAFERFHPQHPAERLPLELAEPIPGPTTDAFCELARETGAVIVPNLYEQAGPRAFDSSPVIDGDGTILGVTRMLHITDFEQFHERSYYAPGDRGVPVYETRAGRLGVAICYDRHYPEVMRSLGLQGAELVVVPQAGTVGEWPEGLYEAELRVASFQNGYFTALVNRVGPEDDMTFAGESFVCNPGGEVVSRAPMGQDHVLTADLDLAEVPRSHARRLFLPDRRPEIVPGLLGFQER